MEEIIEAERRELEQARQQLFLDRMTFKTSIISSISLNCCSLISNFCRVTLTAAETRRVISRQLFLDRMTFKKRVKEAQDALQTVSLQGPNEHTNQSLPSR
jgi:hypothetical protein